MITFDLRIVFLFYTDLLYKGYNSGIEIKKIEEFSECTEFPKTMHSP